MSTKRQKAGFTLVELLVATTVTALVAGATVGILRSTSAACQRADAQLAVQQQARSAVQAISTALANAYREGGSESRLLGLDDWRGEVPADRVRFLTVSRKSVRLGQPESDVKQCEFFLTEPTEDAPAGLARRIDPTRNEEPDDGGVVELVAENVLGLNLTYHDGLGWRSDWPEDMRGWPVAVRIQLAVVNGKEPGKVWTTSRVVGFGYKNDQGESRTE